jgi:hypothetical protein
MRILVSGLIAVSFLASSAFAGNVALLSLGATATCGGTPTCALGNYPASDAIDGTESYNGSGVDTDVWVAPGGTASPYLLINLGQLYTVDSVTISGQGSTALFTMGFEVFVGGAADSTAALLLSSGTQITPGTVVQTDGIRNALWNDLYSVSTASKIQYVLLDVTQSNNSNNPTWDDAAAAEITVDAVPEPGTLGLIGAGLLALGFTRRSRARK